MSREEEVYNFILGKTPKIDDSSWIQAYLTGQRYLEYTSRVNFELSVWSICKPDKELANRVMELADKKLKECTSKNTNSE